MAGEGKRYRGVVLEHVFGYVLAFDQLADEIALRLHDAVGVEAARYLRHHDCYRRRTIDLKTRTCEFVPEDWLFDEEHAAVARAACHQMLRPLKNKIPSQMRETQNVGQ